MICPRTGKDLKRRRAPTWVSFVLFVLAGLCALVWFLIRVVPKPSRAAYPCQRAAMPLAASFVLWVIGITGSLLAFRKAAKCMVQARYAVSGICVVVGIAIACWALSLPDKEVLAQWTPGDPPNTPIGTAKGIHPGRVVWARDPDATVWNGSSGNWWSDANTDQAIVDQMMSRSIRELTGEASDPAAWDALFRHFNRTHKRGDAGYQAGERIAIKINCNNSTSYTDTDNQADASPQTMLAVLRQLARQAGIPQGDITVYEAPNTPPTRIIPDRIFHKCRAEFPDVVYADCAAGGGRASIQWTADMIAYSAQHGCGKSIPRVVADATYLINMALLKGHSTAGVTLTGKNHYGSIRSREHSYISVKDRGMGTYSPFVDFMGFAHFGGKTVLYLIDGLYGTRSVGSRVDTDGRWNNLFDGHWSSSLFLSQDPVAIDSVGLDFLLAEFGSSLGGNPTNADNYLHEAGLAHDPPSGAFYDPNGTGTRLASLGVHEHWNNAVDKQYSRNLGTGEGIELVSVSGIGGGFRRGDANTDGDVDVSDAIRILLYLFARGGEPSCLSAADANDTGNVDITDAIHLLEYLFRSGSALPPPVGFCGDDPTADDLGCEEYTPCAAPTVLELVTAESPATVLIPADGSLGLTWAQVGFDDSAWTAGQAAVGYDENPDYREHFTTDVGPQMNEVSTTAYIRVPFAGGGPRSVERLTLWVKYDDGFVAYLNGIRVASANAPASPAWDSEATGQHSDGQAVNYEAFDITHAAGAIEVGDNLLAMHGLNEGLTSSDFLIVTALDARVR